ncbi:MAG: peptide chain release factor 1 [Halothece sp. Uz-M2-17]|nr:peptide chain release factor 1 [Halothece sp. Uz-M2-17]
MNDPLRRLKSQPWKPLFLVALGTIALAKGIDYLLVFLMVSIPNLQQNLNLILSPPLGILVPLATGVGVGVLGVYICDRFQSQIFLNAGSLWALVACLGIIFALAGLIPLPSFFARLSYPTFLGMMVGVFWKGRYYWR